MNRELFAELILPLALGHTFTYSIPEELRPMVQIGVRVEVNFGKKRHYAGIVHSLKGHADKKKNIKDIIAVLDDQPVITPQQIEFWEWVSDYYLCHLGEVMSVALPPVMKLSSETKVIASKQFMEMPDELLSESEYKVKQYLSIKHEMSTDDLAAVLQESPIHGWIQEMVRRDLLIVYEALDPVVSERKKEIILLKEEILASQEKQVQLFSDLSRSKHQTQALMGILFLAKQQRYVIWDTLKKRFDVPRSAIKALEKKGWLRLDKIGLSEMMSHEIQMKLSPLSNEQQEVYDRLQSIWSEYSVFLLHGVTGSGKTHLYAEKMRKTWEEDPAAQILFLLPEIALTQITLVRLQQLFGPEVMVYHSRLTPKERMTCWNKVLKGQRLIIGPRSAIFLPYVRLRLLIVDEEHDPSFMQMDRKPHFNGRDAAIMMAKQQGAKVILGSATPSLETLWKSYTDKFAYLNLKNRYGASQLPDIQLVDMAKAKKEGTIQGTLSGELIKEMEETLSRKKQVLLFQNRRGHSPVYLCSRCQWKAMCSNCDVALTYHKYFHRLVCHLCNFSYPAVEVCPQCGSDQIEKIGLGTERIEDEIKTLFPQFEIARLDTDTGARKYAAQEILEDFQNHKTDILVGTQMITKGLDFDHIGLVGIVMADALLHFPDYRAMERAFQLMMQVSGRAGRREEKGKVMIQTFQAAHPVFADLIQHQYLQFAQKDLQERKKFLYPPFCRMIKLELRHKNPKQVEQAAKMLGDWLRHNLGKRVVGPAQPGISRIRNLYIQHLAIKMELDSVKIKKIKQLVKEEINNLRKVKGMSTVRVDIYVDI